MRGKQLGREEKRDDKKLWQVEENCEEKSENSMR
jgi:hypothetical protein